MKKVFTAILCMGMLVVGSTTAYAQDIGSFGDGGFGDTATSTMTYDIDSTYIVSIPATINMNQENKLTSNMMDIKSNELVEVYMIIPGGSEPPVRTLRATIPENESHIFR